MDDSALTGYIRQEIRKEVYDDRIELYLPFYFGAGDFAPLCLTWDNENGALYLRFRRNELTIAQAVIRLQQAVAVICEMGSV